MSDNNNSAGTVLVAFALGAIAGAAVALLYAPASGEETRRKLAEKAREGRDKAETLAREGREFFDRQRENGHRRRRARPRSLRSGSKGAAVIDWQLVCLAVIAMAVTVMTVVQIAVLLALARSARQVAETVQQVRQEIRPLAEKVHRIADDAARAAALARDTGRARGPGALDRRPSGWTRR